MKTLKCKFILIVLIFTVVIVLLFFLESYTINYMNSVGEKTALSLLSDNAYQAREVFDNHIRYIWNEIDIIDLGLSNMTEPKEDDVLVYLDKSLPNAKNISIVLDNDKYIDINHKTGDIVIKSELYPLINDNERVCVLNQSGEIDTLLFASSVTNVKINDNIVKYIFVEYELDSFISLLSLESFSYDGLVSVINSKGLVLFHTKSEYDVNYYFFKNFSDSTFSKNKSINSYDRFESSILKGENKAVIIKEDNKDIIVSYASISSLDWFITITVDYDVVLHDLNESVSSVGSRSIYTSIGIVFLSMILVLIISMDIFKERKEKRKLQELNKSLIDTKKVALDALEEAKSASKYKSIFLSNMSHDIRTPMNAIVGFTSLLEHYYDDKEKVLEYTKKISTSSDHLLNLINNVLDMSKIESGKASLTFSCESIYEIIDEIHTFIAPQVKKKEQNFYINFSNIKHESLIMDKLRINQIILNILSNSVKYTQKGGSISLDVCEKDSDTEVANYVITIKDNGIGMSKEYISKIFESFTREDDSRVNAIQGSGLGMAIAKKIIDLMGGTISVISEKGKGSCFTVYIPFKISGGSKANRFSKNNINKCLIINDSDESLDNVLGYLNEMDLSTKMINSAAMLDDYMFDILFIIPTSNEMFDSIIRNNNLSSKIVIILSDNDNEYNTNVDGVLSIGDSNFIFKLEQIVNSKLESLNSNKNSIIRGKRILVAEDNELNIDILKELLGILGASCVICNNGKEAVNKFLESKPGDYDLIFMDIQMPVMNGYEATKIIRESNHQFAKSIPIIAMTANAFIEDVKDALECGMNAHISKPIKINSIVETLNNILENDVEKC